MWNWAESDNVTQFRAALPLSLLPQPCHYSSLRHIHHFPLPSSFYSSLQFHSSLQFYTVQQFYSSLQFTSSTAAATTTSTTTKLPPYRHPTHFAVSEKGTTQPTLLLPHTYYHNYDCSFDNYSSSSHSDPLSVITEDRRKERHRE